MGFARGGYYYYGGGKLYDQSSYGHYWSRHVGSFPYLLSFCSVFVSPQGGGDRGSGFSLRCLAR